jgi:hypothetical protein
MLAYHVTKTEGAFLTIVREKTLRIGKNIVDGHDYVHLSLTPFVPGSYAVHVICGAPRRKEVARAWIITLEIPDTTPLTPDPSGDGVNYLGEWVACNQNELAIEIVEVTLITDIIRWEEAGKNQDLRRNFEQHLNF